MREITAKEVERLLNEGKELNIIDVREADEVVQGMIPGAVHIPLKAIPARYLELDDDKEYIMVCRSGARSSQAVRFLEEEGIDAVNMKGGMMSWKGKTE
ncbi:rhodanese-like domain-containing protein [Alloiococcus sp. CFN-8]|uniref:rhodanese-like domain-containing protein n=1 Tax=Alloiococcus sp. CFN-8 TaxID=3416081 RepID=UPI003CF4CE20